MTVRPIAISDKHDILHLIEQINLHDGLDYSLTEEWFEYMVGEAGNHGLFVAEMPAELSRGQKSATQPKGNVYGLGTCIVDLASDGIADMLILVHPEHRRRGLGTALYQDILDFCAGNQIRQLRVLVRPRLQDSLDFLIKRNFVPQIYSWKLECDLNDIKFGHAVSIPNQQRYHMREALVDDFDAYRNLMEDCFAHVVDEQHFAQGFADPSITVFFLEEKCLEESSVIGMIALQHRTSMNMVYLYDIGVVEAKRGQGIGSFMISSILEYLRDLGVGKAALVVDGENRKAISLYERLGFRETDREILMEKEL